MFPALLIWPGLWIFRRSQRDAYGKFGLIGYRLTFGGFALATLGQVWDYMLFDPWGHPLHGIGFYLQLIAILMIYAGWILWGLAMIRLKPVTWWRLLIPMLWIQAIPANFVLNNTWLIDRFGFDRGFVSSGLYSLAHVCIGLALWSKHGERS